MLQRIQRTRKKGFKMPKNTLYVGRNAVGVGDFGNPFVVGGLFKIGTGKKQGEFIWLECLDEKYNDGSFIKVRDNAHSVELYKEYLSKYPLSEKKINKLKKYDNLACWCSMDKPCHADVLIEIVNNEL